MHPGDLTCETFVPHVGDAFGLGDARGVGALVLTQATPLAGDAFELVFTGPPDPVLAPGSRSLRHDDLGTLELHLEPAGGDEHAARYRAVVG